MKPLCIFCVLVGMPLFGFAQSSGGKLTGSALQALLTAEGQAVQEVELAHSTEVDLLRAFFEKIAADEKPIADGLHLDGNPFWPSKLVIRFSDGEELTLSGPRRFRLNGKVYQCEETNEMVKQMVRFIKDAKGMKWAPVAYQAGFPLVKNVNRYRLPEPTHFPDARPILTPDKRHRRTEGEKEWSSPGDR